MDVAWIECGEYIAAHIGGDTLIQCLWEPRDPELSFGKSPVRCTDYIRFDKKPNRQSAKSKCSYPPAMSVNAGNGSRAQFRFHKKKPLSDLLPWSRETSVMRPIDEGKPKMGQFDFKGFLCPARASRRLEKGHRSGEPGVAMRPAVLAIITGHPEHRDSNF